MQPPSTLLPVAALLGSLVSLCVGSSFAKGLFPLLGAQGTTAMRLGFSALLLLLFWRPWRWPLSPQGAALILRYGLALGAMNFLFYMALERLPLGIAVAIEFSGPLLLALALSRRALDLLWVACAALGLALLLPLQAGGPRLDPVGVAFALGAALCWALYIVTGKSAGQLHGGQATSLGLAVAALLVIPLGLPHLGPVLGQPSLLLAGLAVGLLSSAIPYSLEMVALKRLPRHTFGILLSLEPAVGALAAMPILGEALTPLQWLAIACVMAASAGSALGAARASAP